MRWRAWVFLGLSVAIPLSQYFVYLFDRSLLLFFAPIVVSIPALFALVLFRNTHAALPTAGPGSSLKTLSILFAGVVAAFLIPAVDGSILVLRGFFIDLFCVAAIATMLGCWMRAAGGRRARH